jgi:hypothetical protein
MYCLHRSLSSVFLLLSVATGTSAGSAHEQDPSFVVILWNGKDAQVVKQGSLSRPDFRRLFLDEYGLRGERLHPPKDSMAIGVLVAHDETSVVTVPIRTWKVGQMASKFLCQGSDDGSPPAFSVVSNSKQDLLSQMEKALLGEE